MVQTLTLMEQTVGTLCTSATFAQALSSYAGSLAAAGDFEGALLLSNRAAQMGDVAAAIVADRIQYHVPSAAAVRVGFPFTLALIPDATTIECQMMASKQLQPMPQASQQTVNTVAGITPLGFQPPVQQQQPRAAPQQVPSAHPTPMMPPPTPYVAPVQSQPSLQIPQSQYSAPQPPQFMQAHPPVTTAPPPQHHHLAAPPQSAPVPHAAQPAVQSTQQHVPSAPVAHVDPVVAAAPVAAAAPAPPVARHVVPPPVAPSSLPQAAIASFDVSCLTNELHQRIASGIIDATVKVTDKRKRDAIEKSGLELFDRLQKGVIPQDVVDSLAAYVASLGTPAAKEHWRKISDAHIGVVQPFLNIKFL